MTALADLPGTLQSRSEFVTESGCQIWMGGCFGSGYGEIYVDGIGIGAHRAAWLCHRGPIPHGLLVLHRCDVRPCINPDHLFLGTHADNVADMIRKGRWVRPPNSWLNRRVS